MGAISDLVPLQVTAKKSVLLLHVINVRVEPWSPALKAVGRVSSGPWLGSRMRAAPAEYASEDVRESVLEVSVGHDVDDRVKCGVEVSDPEEDGDDDVGAGAPVLAADRHCQVPGEKREPAQQEGAHHDAKGHEGFVLLSPRCVNSMPLAKPCTTTKRRRVTFV